MSDVWKYKELMEKYIINKYGFNEIKCAKNIKDNILILLCYYENNPKIYRHQFSFEEINKIIKLRERKLERINSNPIIDLTKINNIL